MAQAGRHLCLQPFRSFLCSLFRLLGEIQLRCLLLLELAASFFQHAGGLAPVPLLLCMALGCGSGLLLKLGDAL